MEAITYDFQGLTIIKIGNSLEHPRSQCSLEIPKEYSFAKERGMFSVAGQEGVFFINNGFIYDGFHIQSDLKPNSQVYQILYKEAYDRKLNQLNSLRYSNGFGPVHNLVGFNIRKVSDEKPYIGHLLTHVITEDLFEFHEWLCDPKLVTGIYRITNTSEIFFIGSTSINFLGDENQHPLLDRLEKMFPQRRTSFDDLDEGPFGGAFRSDEDYISYLDASLLR